MTWMGIACGTSTTDESSSEGDASANGEQPPSGATFAIGGTVVGLEGSGLVLRNNAGDDLTVTEDGSFTFPTRLAPGAAYDVTVKAQPKSPSQTCKVSGGTGTVGSGDVASILVNCTTNKYAIGGTVTGLVGTGLVLQVNGGSDLPVTANGTFAFQTPIASGQSYIVTVLSQPENPWQTCTINNPSGTVEDAAIEAVAVTCARDSYKVKGTVTGLVGSGLVLENHDGDTLPINGDGVFEFPTPVESGATFHVQVKDSPVSPKQTCVVSPASGTVAGADTNVAVTCTTDKFKVNGTLTGLTHGTIILQNNGGDDLALTADGPFSFETAVEDGKTYEVSVLSRPGDLMCTVTDKTGTINTDDVTVTVECKKYNRVFVTSEAYNGNLGGVTGADAKCQALADAANLGGTYRAWLSASGQAANSRLIHSIHPYGLVDGTLIANDWDHLVSQDLDLAAPISLHALMRHQYQRRMRTRPVPDPNASRMRHAPATESRTSVSPPAIAIVSSVATREART